MHLDLVEMGNLWRIYDVQLPFVGRNRNARIENLGVT